MPKDMLGSVVRAAVGVSQDRLDLLAKIASALASSCGAEWHAQFKNALKAGLPAESPEALLEHVGMVSVSATINKFVAKEKFVRDTGDTAQVKSNYLGDNFDEWVLSCDCKVEELTSEKVLHYAKLRKGSADTPIIAELGGEVGAEVTLSEMFSLMEKQKNGENGVLLNNGYANIFYIKDQKGVLRTVYVYWGSDGWGASALAVSYPILWDAGRRVFSRNSAL